LEFDPDDVVGSTSNMGPVKNLLILQNVNFIEPLGAVFGDPDVPGMIGGNQSLGIAAINTLQNQDTPVRNNDGLTTIPVDVGPDLTSAITHIKEFNVSFFNDDEFTGFVNNAGTILTNSALFPHVGATVQIRKSIQGDLNGDGFVTAADVPVFLNAMAEAESVKLQFPWLRVDYVADFNADSVIDARDIPAFQQACGCVVPEPATGLLALLAIPLAIGARSKRRAA
jgi:hypothetical protein